MKKDNLFTYAYKGFLSIIYFVIGKKDKVRELFVNNEDNNNLFIDENDVFDVSGDDLGAVLLEKTQTDKLHFSYKARDQKGKIIRSTFDAYNIEQAKRFLTQEGLEIIEPPGYSGSPHRRS